jgi:hypothetical protein
MTDSGGRTVFPAYSFQTVRRVAGQDIANDVKQTLQCDDIPCDDIPAGIENVLYIKPADVPNRHAEGFRQCEAESVNCNKDVRKLFFAELNIF